MPVGQQLETKPRALFGRTFGAVIRNVHCTVHRLHPVADIARTPFLPEVAARLALAAAPQRVNVEAVATGISFSA